MMRFLFLMIFFAIPHLMLAQNIQLHYDMGKARKYLTSTVEMFKPDQCGSTFFFIDMDYNGVENARGVTMAYWEVARAFRLRESPISFHSEYNGGFGQFSDGSTKGAYQIENAFLNGLEFSWAAKDFSRGFTLQVLHKLIQGKHDFSYQLTGVWYLNLAGGKFSFTGFADFWREDIYFETGKTKFCLCAEPQLWYNIDAHFAVGGETETDINFGGFRGFHLYPTLGAKYTF